MGALLLADEEPPLITINEHGRSPFVLICEHAARLLPKRLGALGLPESDLVIVEISERRCIFPS